MTRHELLKDIKDCFGAKSNLDEIDRRLKKLDYLEVALEEIYHRAKVYEQ